MRDLNICIECGGPVPFYTYGQGEWFEIPTREGGSVERGPCCDKECMAKAQAKSKQS